MPLMGSSVDKTKISELEERMLETSQMKFKQKTEREKEREREFPKTGALSKVAIYKKIHIIINI